MTEDATLTTYPGGGKCWRSKRGDIHRIGGPAIEDATGFKQWVQNGKIHREDGPAIVFPNGPNQWWLYGKQYDPIEWMLKVHELNTLWPKK